MLPFIIMGTCLILIGGCKKESSAPNPINSLNQQMVNIPAGVFTMGSPASEIEHGIDEIEHQVNLSAFRISKYEITNAQYAFFLNSKGIGIDGLYAEGDYPTNSLIYANSGNKNWGLDYISSRWVPGAGFENHPVVLVTWYGAMEFANYMGASLPTEAQWEYACRAGTTTPFNTGNCITNLQANYDWSNPYNLSCTNTNMTTPEKTQPVGTYPANAYGLFDMHGNVWEWCSDLYDAYPTTPQTDPTGATLGSNRVYRGGSINHAKYCRSAIRSYSTPLNYSYYIGFRIVMIP